MKTTKLTFFCPIIKDHYAFQGLKVVKETMTASMDHATTTIPLVYLERDGKVPVTAKTFSICGTPGGEKVLSLFLQVQ